MSFGGCLYLYTQQGPKAQVLSLPSSQLWAGHVIKLANQMHHSSLIWELMAGP